MFARSVALSAEFGAVRPLVFAMLSSRGLVNRPPIGRSEPKIVTTNPPAARAESA